MLKVAFIDDGIIPIFDCLQIEYYVVKNGMVVSDKIGNCCRKHSHATTCVAIFLKHLAKNIDQVQIISLRVLNENGNGALDDVVSAIDWAIKNNVKIINLSLGGTHFFQASLYDPLIRKAQIAKTIVVAAQSNDGIYTYPASLPNVIGVKSSDIVSSGIYLNDLFLFDGVEFCANSVFDLDIYTPNGHRTETSNSFAAPVVTALVLDICLENPQLDVFTIKQAICLKFGLDFKYIEPDYRSCYLEKLFNNTAYMDIAIDVPIVKFLLPNFSDNSDKFFYFKLLYSIAILFQNEGYNCKILTDIDFSSSYQLEKFYPLNNFIISELVKYQNIDVLFIVYRESSNLILDIEFDMNLHIDKDNSDADKLFLTIKNNFE